MAYTTKGEARGEPEVGPGPGLTSVSSSNQHYGIPPPAPVFGKNIERENHFGALINTFGKFFG